MPAVKPVATTSKSSHELVESNTVKNNSVQPINIYENENLEKGTYL
jgi:hypothetical protein